MNWLELSKVLGIAGTIIVVIVLASVWLIRKITEQILARDLVQFKSDLEKEAIEFKIRYEEIQGERVRVIKEVYRKIVRSYKTFDSMILEGPQPKIKSKLKKAAKNAANDLVNYYDENRIFFEEELAGDIDSLLSNFRSIWAKSETSRISGILRDSKAAIDHWKSAFNQIQEKTPDLKKQLENKFRKIIGIE